VLTQTEETPAVVDSPVGVLFVGQSIKRYLLTKKWNGIASAPLIYKAPQPAAACHF
jgi:hypothetical protein